MSEKDGVKFNDVMNGRGPSKFRAYRDLYYGNASLGMVVYTELVFLFVNALPGALGLLLRSKLYRPFFKSVGSGVVFGRNLTLRHASKISIGDHVVIDDNCMLDAKGQTNRGITLGNHVYIGRHTIINCKNGNITLGDRVNISSSCTFFSSNALEVQADTVVGAYTYLLSGGEYDYSLPEPFSQQSGMNTQGPLVIGPNCWLAARITVLDAACIGEHCVIGAGAVVNKPIPAHHVAVGVPARTIKTL